VNVGSLFAGVGGFELGLERAGFEIAWQVELDPYCRAVLEARFPGAGRFEDVRAVDAETLAPVDVLCGGFPCQDLSVAGKGAGLGGARSGLWSEFARLVRELRPGYVLVENVPGLLTGKGKRWDRAPVGRVLGDLAEIGYDAEWACLSAGEFGAPHLRKRVWIVAYPGSAGTGVEEHRGRRQGRQPAGASEPTLLRQEDGQGRPERPRPDRADVADPPRDAEARAASMSGTERQRARSRGAKRRAREVPDATGRRSRPRRPQCGAEAGAATGSGGSGGHWAVEPDVGRVAHGVPDRVDRLAALGNALVPQIAEWIGRRILEHEAASVTATGLHRGVHPGVRRGVHPGVRRDPRQTRRIPHRGAESAGPKKLRSTRHTEAQS
jgi:DNA (cytosine-5)-methyltransferase 1